MYTLVNFYHSPPPQNGDFITVSFHRFYLQANLEANHLPQATLLPRAQPPAHASHWHSFLTGPHASSSCRFPAQNRPWVTPTLTLVSTFSASPSQSTRFKIANPTPSVPHPTSRTCHYITSSAFYLFISLAFSLFLGQKPTCFFLQRSRQKIF